LHLVGILFPHINDDARSKSHQIFILEFEVSKNRKEWKIVVKGFENLLNFPHVFGAVDGEHIHIVPPPHIGSYYCNYTAAHSVMLMAIVKENCEFILADFGVNGCISDGGVLECTEFYNMLNYLLTYLLNPFQPKLILVHTTVTGTCRCTYKTCKNWPLCSYVG